GRQIATEWENRKRLAPGVTTPLIEDLVARASAAGATAAKVCGAGGGGCLFCYRPPSARDAIAAALAAGGARRPDQRLETEAQRLGYRRYRPRPARDRGPARDQGRQPVQDPRVPEWRRHRLQPSARARGARRNRAARDPWHRQRPGGADSRDRRDRRH